MHYVSHFKKLYDGKIPIKKITSVTSFVGTEYSCDVGKEPVQQITTSQPDVFKLLMLLSLLIACSELLMPLAKAVGVSSVYK